MADSCDTLIIILMTVAILTGISIIIMREVHKDKFTTVAYGKDKKLSESDMREFAEELGTEMKNCIDERIRFGPGDVGAATGDCYHRIVNKIHESA